MARKLRAHARAVAVHQVEHALRHAGLVQDLGKEMPDSGAISDGFSTIVQPASSAGITFSVTWFIGQFHGVISAQTPTASRMMRSFGGVIAQRRDRTRSARRP
jgi:hypothetical protein